MFKRFTAALVALVLGVALSLVGTTTAQAQPLRQSVAAPCTPSPAKTIHHEAVSHIQFQRYSYNPKERHSANPNEATPPSTPLSDAHHWQANTTNYTGEHGTDPIGATFFEGNGKGGDNGSWFFWTKTTVIDAKAYDEVIPAVTCSDASIAVKALAAICDGTPVYTETQFPIVNATWDTTAIDNTVGVHTRGATATSGHLFAATTSNTASLTYTVPASLGTTQSTNAEAACYVRPSTVTYDTVVWSMPSPNTGTAATYPQVGIYQYKNEATETLDVSVPTTCGTQYQVDVYLQTNGEVNNTAALDALFAAGLKRPYGAQDGKYLAGQSGNPGVAGLGHAWKFVKNADCVKQPPTVQACTTYGSVVSHDLTGWDTSDTRATGHYAVTADGLHIYTEGATSTDKVAAYYSTSFALANAGTKTVGDSLDYTKNFGIAPGLQQVVDFNNDGTPDGILVGETVYGGTDWWLNNSGTLPGSPTLPAAMTTGGSGSARHGTLNEWLALYPAAHVRAVGFSLGSGVYGDGIVKRITLGCVNYTFTPAVAQDLTPVSAGDPTNTNQTCSESGLVGGVIKVVITPHVDYVITYDAEGGVSFNPTTGETGPLAPGDYTVAVTAAEGYELTSEASYSLTIAAHTGTCKQLVEHPIVTPIVTSSQLGCTTGGSYTLSNDLSAPDGVIWTVDGSPVSAGTYQVTSAGTVNVHAAPNGPSYGFGEGQQQDFTLTFARAASCDLNTLALHDGTLASTGTNPTGLLVLAGFLALFGLALMRRARRLS